jgi:hypothetical protein
LDFREIFKLSFDVLEERKVRSALTIVMVMEAVPVAVNRFGAGFTVFFNLVRSKIRILIEVQE